MNQERRDKIIKDHPLLFAYCSYFEHQDGWLDIIEELANKLEPLIEKCLRERVTPCVARIKNFKQVPYFEEYDYPHAIQVKEKFGTLRFYMSHATDEMYKLREEAELKSSETCELCGKPGHRRNTAWISTLCEECFSNGKK